MSITGPPCVVASAEAGDPSDEAGIVHSGPDVLPWSNLPVPDPFPPGEPPDPSEQPQVTPASVTQSASVAARATPRAERNPL